MREIALVAVLLSTAAPGYGAIGSCPISADFINEPEVLETVVPLGGMEVSTTTYRSFVRGALVSVECIEISPDTVFPGVDDPGILQIYARFWSIEPIQDGDGGISRQTYPIPHFMMTGTKAIQDIEVTYTYRLFRFPSAMAVVATGAPAGSRNNTDVDRFLTSLQVEEVTPDFTEHEKLVGQKNHLASCLPAVRADNEKRRLGLTEREISFLCSCTGVRYFEEFSRGELRRIAVGDDPALAARREDIQVQCFEEALR